MNKRTSRKEQIDKVGSYINADYLLKIKSSKRINVLSIKSSNLIMSVSGIGFFKYKLVFPDKKNFF